MSGLPYMSFQKMQNSVDFMGSNVRSIPYYASERRCTGTVDVGDDDKLVPIRSSDDAHPSFRLVRICTCLDRNREVLGWRAGTCVIAEIGVAGESLCGSRDARKDSGDHKDSMLLAIESWKESTLRERTEEMKLGVDVTGVVGIAEDVLVVNSFRGPVDAPPRDYGSGWEVTLFEGE